MAEKVLLAPWRRREPKFLRLRHRRSRVVEKRHEAEIHVQLLVAVEER